ncbi:MAG: cob(I)yrinic acid a,c-diamide adenosyltransferase [Bacteroidota bacterium]|jgi:cob(I)alamin adenosyltransferase|nr:cob(I)yrinic acid a,c-diamide adenosyltransferase [Bacteroidota bacterium]MCA6445225.1 cob(I)yrinic acid a,c-diamide adenosyltransferase [Bacteroidota bacterium]
MAFKIYTKTGDKGQTSLIGGTRLPKQHIRIEAYGTVDELNSYLGLIRDTVQDKKIIDLIIEIQDRLFTIGSHLAADPEKNKMTLPIMHESDVVKLEEEIDAINAVVPEMKFFVLPGGHICVSHCHVARCICRRAERAVLRLAENETVDEIHYKYLNRLSDYIFMLSRYITHVNKVEEIPWKPKHG